MDWRNRIEHWRPWAQWAIAPTLIAILDLAVFLPIIQSGYTELLMFIVPAVMVLPTIALIVFYQSFGRSLFQFTVTAFIGAGLLAHIGGNVWVTDTGYSFGIWILNLTLYSVLMAFPMLVWLTIILGIRWMIQRQVGRGRDTETYQEQ